MSDSNNGGGIGFLGLLCLLFITLKLCHVIDWSWWWVLSPFWGGFALIGALLFLASMCFLADKIIKRVKK